MGRRDDDERPAVEVLGAEPEIASVQQVSTGGPGGPRRRGVRGLLVGAAVVGLLVAGLALGDGDDGAPAATEGQDDETTTTRRRPTTTRPRGTTTTTTIAPTGPVFAGQQLRGWLLSGNVSGWTLVDIESGALLDTNLPFDDPYSTRAVTGGVVTVRGGQVSYFDLRVPEDVREPVVLGPADYVLAAAEADQVWLIDGAYEQPADGARARLVDLDGRELRSFAISAAAYMAATADGLLFERGGRVYLVDESGVHSVAIGNVIGAVGSSFLTFTCDDDASCGVDLRRASGERIRRLEIELGSPDSGVEVTSDAFGRFAVVSYGSDGGDPELALFEPDGSVIATIGGTGYFSGPISWLPEDAGLVGAHDGRIAWIHRTDDGWVVEDLQALTSVQSEGVLAILSQ